MLCTGGREPMSSVQGDDGADSITDGPQNDATEDNVSGGLGTDDITTANEPAFRDVVNCGGDYDTVVADSLDEVADDCEDTTLTLSAEEEAAVDPQNQNPPPGADPTVPYDPTAPEESYFRDYPMETSTVTADGTVTTQDIAGTNCRERVDRAHRSGYDNREAKAQIGVRDCDQDKKRIWIRAALQRWIPFEGGGYWRRVRVRKATEYDQRSNVKHVAHKCPTVRTYWYRAVLQEATIVDYDGDTHRMLLPRKGDPSHFKCLKHK